MTEGFQNRWLISRWELRPRCECRSSLQKADANERHDHQIATVAGGDPQQGAARRYFTQAHQPLALQSSDGNAVLTAQSTGLNYG
jgi:hypothetical protein